MRSNLYVYTLIFEPCPILLLDLAIGDESKVGDVRFSSTAISPLATGGAVECIMKLWSGL